MKTSGLIGEPLNWAVAKALGSVPKDWKAIYSNWEARNYSTEWAQGGPIIEREFIAVFSVEARPGSGQWAAEQNRHRQTDSDEMGDKIYSFYTGGLSYGLTPLIAAMRCFVASKLGAEVDIPRELENV